VNGPADESPTAAPSHKTLSVFDAYVTIGRDNKTFVLRADGHAEVQVSRQDLADAMGWSSRATPRLHVLGLQSAGLIETTGPVTVLNLAGREALGTAAPVLRLVGDNTELVSEPVDLPATSGGDATAIPSRAVLDFAQVLFDAAAGITETAATMPERDSALEVLATATTVAAAASALIGIAETQTARAICARDDCADGDQGARNRAKNAQASRARTPIFPPKGGRLMNESIGPRDNQPPPTARGSTARTRTQTIELVKPLHEASVAAGGEGITNETGVHELLTGLTSEQLTTGVAKLLTQTEVHAGSLVGVLCNRAKEPDNCSAFWNDPLPQVGPATSPLKGTVSEGRIHDGTRWVEQ